MNQFQDEIFCKVNGYEKYEISNFGTIKNCKTGRILKQNFTGAEGNQYYSVNLSFKGKVKSHSIHVLVALAFCENPDGEPCVDHRDNDKTNNMYDNLRWCQYLQNNMSKLKTTKPTSSRYKGVSFAKHRNKFVAYIAIHGKNKNLGGFENAVDAAKKYDQFAREHYREFAKPNFNL